MTPAQIHAAAFGHPYAHGWGPTDFDAIADDGTLHLVQNGHSFALARLILDEAELLLSATAPAMQRQGLAARTLTALHQELAQSGARRIFLEVAATNEPAITLYSTLGYHVSGTRKDYYREGGVLVDATLMELALNA